ncbi:MAG: ribosome maturation factor RimP [Armatimonadetes bacterium]|nr:ribosome maturation factor RimP [Armatimonadota bacterium]
MKRKANPLEDKIFGEIDQTLTVFGFELVDLKVGGRRGNRTVTVLMDKPGGVTVADCQYMSSRLSLLLDAVDPIEGRYTLVVSSPGVERPLVKDADFQRFAGEKAAVRHIGPDGKRRTDTGVIKGLAGQYVELDIEGQGVRIATDDIESARLVYDWDAELGAHEEAGEEVQFDVEDLDEIDDLEPEEDDEDPEED